MRTDAIIKYFQKYFSLEELFSKAVVKKYGEQAWSFLDPRLLEVLIWVREGMGIPLVINTSSLQQRGFRENTCQIVADKTKAGVIYASAHTLGKGVDFSSGRATAPTIRQWIRKHIDECPQHIRLESDKSAPTWVHIDVCNNTENKLVEFSV